jgi:hypothetical protein
VQDDASAAQRDPRPIGMFLRGFNKVFDKTGGYLAGVSFFLRRAIIGLACLAGLCRRRRPHDEGSDRLCALKTLGYFFAVFTLPDGAPWSKRRVDEARGSGDEKRRRR